MHFRNVALMVYSVLKTCGKAVFNNLIHFNSASNLLMSFKLTEEFSS